MRIRKVIFVISTWIILLLACRKDKEISRFLHQVHEKSTLVIDTRYKNVPCDSLYYVFSDTISKIIWQTYTNYDSKNSLLIQLEQDYEMNSSIIRMESLMFFYHMYLNKNKLTNKNLDSYWICFQTAIDNLEKQENQKLQDFVLLNYDNIDPGDTLMIVLEVELDYGIRVMTYGSAYHQIYPKSSFNDSLIITGILIRKGEYPDFQKNSTDLNIDKLWFEIKTLEISDSSVTIKYKGPSDELKTGGLFYLNLEGYGCRYVKQINK
ncbi:MAG: hypothetical protein IT265_01635 [Saprospiraceae bacterium]|nr:hypothetical protein [Saprospiraceae bacterium]